MPADERPRTPRSPRAIRRARPILVVTAIFVALLAIPAAQVRVDPSIETLLPERDPDRTLLDDVTREFGTDEVVRVAVFADDVFAPEILEKLDAMARRLGEIENVRRVDSLPGARGLETTEQGLRYGSLLRSVPPSLEEASAFRSRILGDSAYEPVLVSPDGRATAITVFLDEPSDADEALRIEREVRATVEPFRSSLDVAVAGTPILKAEGGRRMERDVVVFSIAGLGAIAACLLLIFHAVRPVVAALVPVTVGVIGANALLSISGRPLTIASLVLNPLLMAIAVAYAIHVVSRDSRCRAEGLSAPEAAARTLEHVTRPVWIAGLTTAFGFAMLAPHPVPTIRDLGIFAALGTLGVTVASLTVLPALLSLWPDPGRPPTAALRLGGFLAFLAELPERRPRVIFVSAIALAAAALVGLSAVRVETDYVTFFDEATAVRQDTERISSRLGGSYPLFLVVDGPAPRSMLRPEAMAALAELRDLASSDATVRHAAGFLLPIERLRASILDGETGLPGSFEESEQLLSLVATRELDGLLSTDASRSNTILWVQEHGSEDLDRLATRLERKGAAILPPGYSARVTGTSLLLNRTSDVIAREQMIGVARLVVLFAILFAVVFRSVRIGLLALVPNVFPILLLFGLMGALGIPLNVATSMIAVIALGIAVDDTVHYLTALVESLGRGGTRAEAVRRSIDLVGRPIVFTTLVLTAGFLVAGLSGFAPIRQFGFLAAATMGFALVGDLVLTPALTLGTSLGHAPARGGTLPELSRADDIASGRKP